jgi:hypothetical protein
MLEPTHTRKRKRSQEDSNSVGLSKNLKSAVLNCLEALKKDLDGIEESELGTISERISEHVLVLQNMQNAAETQVFLIFLTLHYHC